jgi:hypothetical protein
MRIAKNADHRISVAHSSRPSALSGAVSVTGGCC